MRYGPTEPSAAGARRSRANVAAFVAALPKAELHLHLVGSASVDTVLRLARRHPDVGVPTEREELQGFYTFSDFARFLDVFTMISRLVRSGADIATLAGGLAADLASCNVRYAEVQVTPTTHRKVGIGFEELSEALTTSREQALRRHDVELGWVFDIDSELGTTAALDTLRFAAEYRPLGTVGLGLGGAERGIHRADYAAVFRSAREAGLHSLPHAGETVGAGEVWASVTELGAQRVGHGIRAVDDPVLLEYLARHDIALEVCPSSNVRTGAVSTLDDHPLPALVEAGVPVTLATDDPGLFGTDLNAEFLLCHKVFGFGVATLARLAHTGARFAHCSDKRRSELLTGIGRVTHHFGV